MDVASVASLHIVFHWKSRESTWKYTSPSRHREGAYDTTGLWGDVASVATDVRNVGSACHTRKPANAVTSSVERWFHIDFHENVDTLEMRWTAYLHEWQSLQLSPLTSLRFVLPAPCYDAASVRDAEGWSVGRPMCLTKFRAGDSYAAHKNQDEWWSLTSHNQSVAEFYGNCCHLRWCHEFPFLFPRICKIDCSVLVPLTFYVHTPSQHWASHRHFVVCNKPTLNKSVCKDSWVWFPWNYLKSSGFRYKLSRSLLSPSWNNHCIASVVSCSSPQMKHVVFQGFSKNSLPKKSPKLVIFALREEIYCV